MEEAAQRRRARNPQTENRCRRCRQSSSLDSGRHKKSDLIEKLMVFVASSFYTYPISSDKRIKRMKSFPFRPIFLFFFVASTGGPCPAADLLHKKVQSVQKSRIDSTTSPPVEENGQLRDIKLDRQKWRDGQNEIVNDGNRNAVT